jgi:hypothetical protein
VVPHSGGTVALRISSKVLNGLSARIDSISLVSSGDPIQANFAQSKATSFWPAS